MTEEIQARELTIDQAIAVGIQLAVKGDHQSAAGLFRAVLQHEPKNFDAILRLGVSCFDMHRTYEAFYWLQRAHKMQPKNPMAIMNYGLCLSQLGHTDEGLPYLERACALGEKLKLDSEVRALYYNNLGNSLERLNRYKDALVALDKGLVLNPFDDFPHYNKGVVLLRLNRHREAIASLYRSLELKRERHEFSTSRLNEADTYYNLSMAHLLLGELKEGFGYYDARLATTDSELLPYFGLPIDKRWKPGQSIEGKRVLIHGEQGLGDAIHMMRFLSWLRSLNPAELLFVEHTAIKPLLHDQAVTVLEIGQKMDDCYDLWTGLMSLPLHYGIEREDQIPPPFEIADDIDRNYAVQKLLPPANEPRIGVCWSGNFRHKNDAHRSIALKTFASLFEIPLLNFISLQQVRQNEEEEFAELVNRHPNLHPWKLEDFRDTAAVIRQLDLVVTVDTSVAHLAGTLGVPTWILIPKMSTDWRWQLERTDSPWYPSVTLYRQPKIGDWKTVLDRVKRDLTETAAQRVAATAA